MVCWTFLKACDTPLVSEGSFYLAQNRFASILGQFQVSTQVYSEAMSEILHSLIFASAAMDGSIPSGNTHVLLLSNILPNLNWSCLYTKCFYPTFRIYSVFVELSFSSHAEFTPECHLLNEVSFPNYHSSIPRLSQLPK